MTVLELIELSLNDIGVTNPRSENIETAFKHLNMIVSNFTYWNPADTPIERFDTLSDVIQLPAYYLEIFELMLAAREALSYQIPVTEITFLETKVKQLTDRLTYRRLVNGGINASGMVI